MTKSKKNSVTKIFVLIFLVVFLIGSCVAVVYFFPDIKDFIVSMQQQAELQDEINALLPDKDPDSIIIPDDATPEEKAELKEEIEYWSVVHVFKEKLSKSKGVDSLYHVVEIKSITCSEEHLFFEVSAYFVGSNEEKKKAIVRFAILCGQEINSCAELLNFLRTSEDDFQLSYASMELADAQRYRNCIDRVKDSIDFLKDIESYEIYGINSETGYDTQFDLPVWFSAFIKCKNKDGSTKLIRTTFSLSDGKYEETNEGVEQYYNQGKYRFSDTIIYDELGFDWEELNEKYKLNDFQVANH